MFNIPYGTMLWNNRARPRCTGHNCQVSGRFASTGHEARPRAARAHSLLAVMLDRGGICRCMLTILRVSSLVSLGRLYSKVV